MRSRAISVRWMGFLLILLGGSLSPGLVQATDLPFTLNLVPIHPGAPESNIGRNWISLPSNSPIKSAEELCAIPNALTVAQGFPAEDGAGASREWVYDCVTGICTPGALTAAASEPGCAFSSCFCVDPGEGFAVRVSAPSSIEITGTESPVSINLPAASRNYWISVPFQSNLVNANDLGLAVGLVCTGFPLRGTVLKIDPITGASTAVNCGTAQASALTLQPGRAYRIRYTNDLPHSYTNPTTANPDADGDGTLDNVDPCTDTDGDGFGNPGFPANTCAIDNCPTFPNSGQTDGDNDGLGDVCDVCAGPGTIDSDGDGLCNSSDPDDDADGVDDGSDNCPQKANPDQNDADDDSIGDACDGNVPPIVNAASGQEIEVDGQFGPPAGEWSDVNPAAFLVGKSKVYSGLDAGRQAIYLMYDVAQSTIPIAIGERVGPISFKVGNGSFFDVFIIQGGADTHFGPNPATSAGGAGDSVEVFLNGQPFDNGAGCVEGAVDFNATSPNFPSPHNVFELEVHLTGVPGGCYSPEPAFWSARLPVVLEVAPPPPAPPVESAASRPRPPSAPTTMQTIEVSSAFVHIDDTTGVTSVSPNVEGPVGDATCADGLDNDGDGSVDAADPDCGTIVCGDGAMQFGEQCDDGNAVNGDCCSSGCQYEAAGATCSDGNVCTVGDACTSGACSSGGLRDADSDGHVDGACGGNDCNDADALVWFAPQEVTGVLVSGAVPTDISWSDQGTAVGPGTTYDLASGPLDSSGTPNFGAGVCVQTAGGPGFSDARPDPSIGSAYWYLARGRNSCGIGTYGTSGRDASIPACP